MPTLERLGLCLVEVDGLLDDKVRKTSLTHVRMIFNIRTDFPFSNPLYDPELAIIASAYFLCLPLHVYIRKCYLQ